MPPNPKIPQLHASQRKAERTVLVHFRMGRIGLRHFLKNARIRIGPVEVRHWTGNAKACLPRLPRRRKALEISKGIPGSTSGFQDAIRHQQRDTGSKQVDNQNRKNCPVPACKPAFIRRGRRVEA